MSAIRVNRVAIIITAIVLAAGGLMSAQAASAANNCASGKGCLYGYGDYTDLLVTKSGGAGLSNLTGAAKNEAASWGNGSNYYGCVYDNAGGTGQSWTITPTSSSSFLLLDRDRAESWKLNGTGC